MLEVSRDAIKAEVEQLVSCAAEQSKYCSICTVTLDPYLRRFTFYELGPLAVAALKIGVGPSSLPETKTSFFFGIQPERSAQVETYFAAGAARK
jgi:hypothetical protein